LAQATRGVLAIVAQIPLVGRMDRAAMAAEIRSAARASEDRPTRGVFAIRPVACKRARRMRPLFSPAGRARVQQAMNEGPLLAFDWDGTLVPIAVRPEHAPMDRATAKAFRTVSERWPTAIVSGRARKDLRVLAGELGPVALIGNHGMETGLRDSRAPQWRRQVRSWQRQLVGLERFPGVFVEGKGFSLSIHYREAADRKRARQRIGSALRPLQGARLIVGKAVVNVLPADAPTKGTSVCDLARRLGKRSIVFLGDDVTDEDVFRLAPDPEADLVGIRVGRKKGSAAQWFIRTQSHLVRLLTLLASF
jgi:trehalose 6-phosphate phosphatase